MSGRLSRGKPPNRIQLRTTIILLVFFLSACNLQFSISLSKYAGHATRPPWSGHRVNRLRPPAPLFALNAHHRVQYAPSSPLLSSLFRQDGLLWASSSAWLTITTRPLPLSFKRTPNAIGLVRLPCFFLPATLPPVSLLLEGPHRPSGTTGLRRHPLRHLGLVHDRFLPRVRHLLETDVGQLSMFLSQSLA